MCVCVRVRVLVRVRVRVRVCVCVCACVCMGWISAADRQLAVDVSKSVNITAVPFLYQSPIAPAGPPQQSSSSPPQRSTR